MCFASRACRLACRARESPSLLNTPRGSARGAGDCFLPHPANYCSSSSPSFMSCASFAVFSPTETARRSSLGIGLWGRLSGPGTIRNGAGMEHCPRGTPAGRRRILPLVHPPLSHSLFCPSIFECPWRALQTDPGDGSVQVARGGAKVIAFRDSRPAGPKSCPSPGGRDARVRREPRLALLAARSVNLIR